MNAPITNMQDNAMNTPSLVNVNDFGQYLTYTSLQEWERVWQRSLTDDFNHQDQYCSFAQLD